MTRRSATVTITRYDGADFPEADAQFEQFTADQLAALWPDIDWSVEFGLAARVDLGRPYADTDDDLIEEVKSFVGNECWSAFCESFSSAVAS